MTGSGAGRPAASWVEHLRAGGTTPWPAWRDGTDATPAPAGQHRVPGAQQLELLRRINLAGRPDATLVERVLTAGTTGRGRPDLDLVGPPRQEGRGGHETRGGRFGAAAVDPTGLAAEELLRVAVGLVAEELAATPPPPVVPPAWSFLLRRRYRVVGDPRLADPVREELVRRGRTIGGRDSRVLVLGAGTEQMLADAWVSRFLDAGAPAWPEWLAEWAGRDGVPTRVDLAAAARHWAGQEGVRKVHVVVDPAAVGRLVHSRTLPAPPEPVPAQAAELARRVAAVLGVLVEERRRELLVGRVLLPWLSEVARGVDPGAPPPGVPARLRPWLRRTAARVHAGVLSGGYPVHGDPDRLLDEHEGAAPTASGALEVAVAALLRSTAAVTTDGTRGDGA